MDFATIAGVLIAFIAIFASMILEGGNPMAIFLIPALLLVFVGTIGAGLAGGLLCDGQPPVKALVLASAANPPPPAGTFDTVARLSERPRREGLLALESEIREFNNE